MIQNPKGIEKNRKTFYNCRFKQIIVINGDSDELLGAK